MIEVASLRYGVIFKKAFSQPHIFSAFVKDFTGVTIEIDHVETEKSFSPIIGKIDSRFDLFAEDKKNRIIVDIQHKRLSDHYDRFLHYHCAALLEQAVNSKNYSPELRVFTIVVLTSGDRHQTDIAVTDFEPKTLDGEGIGETKHKIMYVCPKYVTEKTKEPYKEWLEAIDDSLDGEVEESHYQNKTIQEIFQLIQKDKTTPQEYARMKEEYSNEEYLQNKLKKAKAKGIKEGVKEGNKNKQLEIAKNLLDVLDIEIIALKTGLSEQEINLLKQKSKK